MKSTLGQDELQKRKTEGRLAASARAKRLGVPSALRAIRAKCLDCAAADGEHWVKDCTIAGCALWFYRMGRKARESDLEVAEINWAGKVTGYHKVGPHDLAQKGRG